MSLRIVFTSATKAEAPVQWLKRNNIPVITRAGAISGVMNALPTHPSIVWMITGVGESASRLSIRWIIDHLSPAHIINIGTVAVAHESLRYQWLRPSCVWSNSFDDNKPIHIVDYLPFPFTEGLIDVDRLCSLDTPLQTQQFPHQSDAVDMEAYSQAALVHTHEAITFHCLKFGSDLGDSQHHLDYHHSLSIYQEHLLRIFQWMEKLPITISAIIPTYNRYAYIKRAVNSILHQRQLPYEIIIVDDGSTDQTHEYLRSIKQQFPELINVVTLDKNYGVSFARNIGISEAKGNWIALLDSDDEWTKNKLVEQSDYINEHPHIELLQSNERWIRNGAHLNQKKYHKKKEGMIWELSLERCMISPSSVMIKSSLLDAFGVFDTALPACEDYDLWLRICRQKVVGLDEKVHLIKYGGHSDQLSSSFIAIDRFRIAALEKQLQNERSVYHRDTIQRVLNKKREIVSSGARKRLRSM